VLFAGVLQSTGRMQPMDDDHPGICKQLYALKLYRGE